MKKILFSLPFLAIGLSSCGVKETISALEANRAAVIESTQAISENVIAIESASRSIDANRKEIEQINATLRKANQDH